MSTTISLVLTTITGYWDGNTISFYGESARALWGLSHIGISYTQDEHYLGASLVIAYDQLDIISPRAIKAGYKMNIIRGKRK